MVDANKFQKIASGINSLVVAVGLILGAFWTYHIFNTELRVQNATAQLEKLNRDLAQEPKLEVDLEMQQLSTDLSKERALIGKLLVKNIGTGTAVLKLADKDKDNPPLHFYKVGWSKDHEDWKHMVSFHLPLDKDMPLGEMVLNAGLTKQVRFSIKVSRPGLYVLVIKIPRNDAEIERVKKAGAKFENFYWCASNYILVK